MFFSYLVLGEKWIRGRLPPPRVGRIEKKKKKNTNPCRRTREMVRETRALAGQRGVIKSLRGAESFAGIEAGRNTLGLFFLEKRRSRNPHLFLGHLGSLSSHAHGGHLAPRHVAALDGGGGGGGGHFGEGETGAARDS